MVSPQEINAALDGLARRFEDEVQTAEDSPSHQGWGQFLDTTRRHSQIGPYGTSAGVVVLTQARQAPGVLGENAARQLLAWWQSREKNNYARERFVQTTRLALVTLALRQSALPQALSEVNSLESTLVERLLPSHLWGDYWLSPTEHDPTPRLFPSAIALLALTLNRSTDCPLDDQVLAAVEALEHRLSDPKLPDYVAAAASAAVLSAKGIAVSARAIKVMQKLAFKFEPIFAEPTTYFYEYEYKSKEGLHLHKQDYVLVPKGLFLCLAGLLPGAPSNLRLAAESTVKMLIRNLHSNQGAFRHGLGARISTVDQIWVALSLSAALQPHEPTRWSARMKYALFRPWSKTLFSEKVFPLSSLIVVAMLNVMSKNLDIWTQVYATIAALAIGSLYGAHYIRHLLPGESE